MFKSKVFYIVIAVLLIVSFFLFKKFHKSKIKNEMVYSMEISGSTNTTKMFGILSVTSGPLSSQEMVNGTLCLQNGDNLEKVDLYMPDMGHGSEPPKVTPTPIPKDDIILNKNVPRLGCYLIESMQLFMPGIWQVRVFYKDGVIGVFNLDLKK